MRITSFYMKGWKLSSSSNGGSFSGCSSSIYIIIIMVVVVAVIEAALVFSISNCWNVFQTKAL